MKQRTLIILFISSLIIRVFCIFFFANTANPQMWEFGKIARNLFQGNGFQYTAISIDVPSAYMPPGLPFLYFVFFKIFGDNINAYIGILLFNAFLASFSVIIIYRIAEFIYDTKIALLTAIYIIVSPVLIFSSVNYNPIIIYQLLIGISYLFFLKTQRNPVTKKKFNITNLKFILILSIALGLFLYFRSEIFGFIIILSFYFLIKKRIIDAVLILIIPIILISPWTIRNYVMFGKLIPVSTSIGYNFFTGHGDDAAAIDFNKRVMNLKEDSSFETEKSKIGFEEAFKYIREHPAEELKESFWKVLSLWFIDKYRENAKNPIYILIWIPTLILFLVGYFKSLKDKNIFYKLYFMNVYLVFSTILVVIFFNIPRYQIQMSYLMIPTAMYGLFSIYENLFGKIKE